MCKIHITDNDSKEYVCTDSNLIPFIVILHIIYFTI